MDDLHERLEMGDEKQEFTLIDPIFQSLAPKVFNFGTEFFTRTPEGETSHRLLRKRKGFFRESLPQFFHLVLGFFGVFALQRPTEISKAFSWDSRPDPAG